MQPSDNSASFRSPQTSYRRDSTSCDSAMRRAQATEIKRNSCEECLESWRRKNNPAPQQTLAMGTQKEETKQPWVWYQPLLTVFYAWTSVLPLTACLRARAPALLDIENNLLRVRPVSDARKFRIFPDPYCDGQGGMSSCDESKVTNMITFLNFIIIELILLELRYCPKGVDNYNSRAPKFGKDSGWSVFEGQNGPSDYWNSLRSWVIYTHEASTRLSTRQRNLSYRWHMILEQLGHLVGFPAVLD